MKNIAKNLPDLVVDSFLTSLEKRINNKGMSECPRCVLSFLVQNGFIKASKIRAYVVTVLYPQALAQAPNKSQAIKSVAEWMDISELQVHNLLSNRTRY